MLALAVMEGIQQADCEVLGTTVTTGAVVAVACGEGPNSMLSTPLTGLVLSEGRGVVPPAPFNPILPSLVEEGWALLCC